MDPKPNLIVLAHSDSWCSAIRRNFTASKLSWVLDPAGLIEVSFESPGAAAIVEVRMTAAADVCKTVFQLSNNSFQIRLFAVGDASLLELSDFLRASGFSAWYWSLLQIPDLASAVAKHHWTARLPEQAIESKVGSTLPWPGAATERQA